MVKGHVLLEPVPGARRPGAAEGSGFGASGGCMRRPLAVSSANSPAGSFTSRSRWLSIAGESGASTSTSFSVFHAPECSVMPLAGAVRRHS